MCRVFLIFTDIPDCAPAVGLAVFADRLTVVFNARGIRPFRIVCFESVLIYCPMGTHPKERRRFDEENQGKIYFGCDGYRRRGSDDGLCV